MTLLYYSVNARSLLMGWLTRDDMRGCRSLLARRWLLEDESGRRRGQRDQSRLAVCDNLGQMRTHRDLVDERSTHARRLAFCIYKY
jgi:hypothetical protein